MEGAGLRDRADGAAAPGGGSRHPGTVRQTPAPRAPDRLVLLLALVPYLLEQGTVGVDEAARHFGVPAERIRRAVRLIAVSGVPGQSRQYLPGDLFDISWDDLEEHDRITLTHRVAIDEAPRFSAREAAALIAGLQYLQSWAGPAGGRVPATLMAKLARSSAGRPSAVAVEPTADASRIAAIRIALDDAVQVEFDYTSVQGESTHRIVDPLRLDSVDQDWYLRAWCHTRQAVRTFRLDRMTGFDVTERPVALQPGQASIPEGLFDGATTDFVIDLAVDTACLPIIGDYLEGDTAGLDAPGRAVVGIRAAHVHGVKRLVCTLGGRAEVLAPESARQAVARWAVDAIAGYASDRVAGRAAS